MITAAQYRAWVDEDNVGHIRILKRVNFILLLSIIRQVVLMQHIPGFLRREIFLYIPESLSGMRSENFCAFIEFTEECCNISISIIENPGDTTEQKN